jgi:hypothetical protein
VVYYSSGFSRGQRYLCLRFWYIIGLTSRVLLWPHSADSTLSQKDMGGIHWCIRHYDGLWLLFQQVHQSVRGFIRSLNFAVHDLPHERILFKYMHDLICVCALHACFDAKFNKSDRVSWRPCRCHVYLYPSCPNTCFVDVRFRVAHCTFWRVLC